MGDNVNQVISVEFLNSLAGLLSKATANGERTRASIKKNNYPNSVIIDVHYPTNSPHLRAPRQELHKFLQKMVRTVSMIENGQYSCHDEEKNG